MNKDYIEFITGLKQNIVQSRYIAAKLANKEQLLLYFRTGKILSEKIAAEKWGAKVLEQIAEDLQKALPGLKGFSAPNLKMRQFALRYTPLLIGSTPSIQLNNSTLLSPTAEIDKNAIRSTLSTQFPDSWYNISFSHHMLLITKCKSNEERFFYINKAASEFWSLRVLEHHINANLYKHQGKMASNFTTTLPGNIKANALQVFQDEYLFDFISLEEDDERVIEGQLVSNIKNMIMTLGKGFSFIGNQYRLEIDGEEFFIDLLFFNRHLQCLVAFELKRGKFKPEYAGQLNFYLNVLDEKVRLPHENPSIGIVLCKEKNNTIVEFAVRTIDKAMGVATYRTTKELPKEMKGILPDAGELAKLL
jgi:predicted nuclease of restriction endonuclease-like (RecB) superfamily